MNVSAETRVEFVPHSEKQDRLIFSDAELTIAATGTQWGKSQGGSLWMKRNIHRHNAPTDNHLLLAPTYKILQQSALPYFLYCMRGLGEYNKVDAEFRLATGGKVFVRTATDPDSIVGIPKVRSFWADEAGKLSLYFWENIQARAAAQGATGLLTTSPYSRNWLYKQYIRPINRKEKLDVPLIQAASWENPYHTLHDPIVRDKRRADMDPRRFDMIFGGEWGQMAGLVYDCWNDEENLVDPFELPVGSKIYGGIDWGYTDPFVMKLRAITPDGRHIGISEFYKTGLTLPDMIELARQKMRLYGQSLKFFYADPSQPGHIEEFNRCGVPCLPADNDIRRGIDLHYELIKTRRYKEFKGACPHSMDERETYHYPEPEDLGPDDDSKEQLPVGQNDHTQDVDRYLTLMTYRREERRTPITGDKPKRPKNLETANDRLARITKLRHTGRTENFS